MLERFMKAIEKRVYGPGAFRTQAAATRALLKFCVEHRYDLSDLEHVRTCLSKLDAGERSNAIQAYKNIRWGKEGFSDWWPPVVLPSENPEYVGEVFMALAERWHRLMENFACGHA
jgi:hypothetical protein